MPPAAPARGDDRHALLQIVEEAYRLPNWNGTSLRAALRRVDAAMASWRPRYAKRSIADIVVHCAYWKYAARRRLSDARRGGFALKGSNWFAIDKPFSPEQWKSYCRLLQTEHEQLCEAIRASAGKLSFKRPRQDGQWTSVQRVFWLAIHDGYHTGQINLLKAMYRRRQQAT